MMEKLNILMLGWSDPLAPAGELEAWPPMALALARRVQVHVVLPGNAPAVTLQNITITDLEKENLPLMRETGSQPETYPFAPAPFPAIPIPLYGTPVYTGREAPKFVQRQPGEAVPTGNLGQPATSQGPTHTAANVPRASLNSQIIQYARNVHRFVQAKHFDGIYAFHWQTFLAAQELKLVKGLKLVLHVHSLSQTRPFTDRLGWMLTLEKIACEKADAILLKNALLAADLEQEYGLPTAKLRVSDQNQEAIDEMLQVFGARDFPASPFLPASAA